MDADYETAYAAIEEHHPWFVARRELFSVLVGERKQARLIDVGCGTGMFLAHLRKRGFEHLAGVETSAALRARFRDPSIALHSELPEGPFDVVFMLDVLEHIEDDQAAIARVYERLVPGGVLFVSVPAHPFLWSAHDERNQHVRRYRRGELRDKLHRGGFLLRRLSWWNLTGFLPALVLRGLRLGARSNELELGSAWSLALLGALLRVENRLARGVGLPIGVSLIAVAEKPAGGADGGQPPSAARSR